MKRPGYCTLCEKPVFKTIGDRLVRPLTPHDDAWRVNFELSDETNSDLTFCEACLPTIPAEMNRIWEICLDSFEDEELAAYERGEIRTDRQQEAVNEFLVHINEQHLVKELSRVRWSELKADGVI